MMSATAHQHWHILGAGAVGRLWACHMRQAGLAVTLLMRNRQRLKQYRGAITLDGQAPPQRFEIPAQSTSEAEPIKRLLVTTKSYDCLDAIRAVQTRIAPNACIVLLQNGMGQQQQIEQQLHGIQLYAATTTEGAFTSSNDGLTHAGRGETWFGPFNAAARAAGSYPLTALLEVLTSGYDPQVVNRLWQKLAINGAINGLTARFNCRNGELASNDGYAEQMRELCAEIESLASKLQQPLFDKPLYQQARQVAQATAENTSSMLVDVRNGSTTEIDFINGFICQQANRIGISLPLNQMLVDEIRSLHPTQTRA